jgi:hypothetical protein
LHSWQYGADLQNGKYPLTLEREWHHESSPI